MRFIAIALPMIVAATPASAAAPRSFENLDRLDSLVTMTVGANIGEPGGPVAPVDRRLRLAACPRTPTVEGPTFGAAVIKCDAIGWRIRVPLSQGGAYAALQQDGLPVAAAPVPAQNPSRVYLSATPAPGFTRPAPPVAAPARVTIVKKGDPVQLVAGNARFQVSRMMIADEDGAVGETIRLRADRTAQAVVGRVEADGIVRVPGFD